MGSSTKNGGLCDTLFSCPTKSLELLNQVGDELNENDFENNDNLKQGRSNCIALGKLCPGISIGCSLCGMFSPGTCGEQCIVAGIYCGVSAFACKAEAQLNKNKNKKRKRPFMTVPKTKLYFN